MRVRTAIAFALPFAFALAAVAADAPKPSAPPASTAPAAPAPPAAKDPNSAGARLKNLQVLQSIPIDDLVPSMQFISASLGVDCAFCHVDHAPEKDDKEPKRTARKMITMTQAINREHFEGHLEVTCMSCHMGKTHPASVPPVAAGQNGVDAGAPEPAALPAASAVLTKYFQAVGGAEALAKITTRVQTGKIIGFGVDPLPINVMSKAPNKRLSHIQNPKGENINGFDGKNAWIFVTGRPVRDMSPADVEAARIDATIMFPSDILALFTELEVVSIDTIDGKPAIKVAGRNQGKLPVHLWFDAQSGLIVRVTRYTATPLGRNPTQIDLADFRAVDGVTIPFRWSVSRLTNSYTIQIDETKQNTTVEDTVFDKPLPEPSAGR